MIIATGNNFGCGAIEIKDYQSEKVVILNAKITFDPKNEAYRNASVLEIYVPDLSLGRSSNSSCFMQSVKLMWPDEYYKREYQVGTVLTTWIKDKNTICIEKLPISTTNWRVLTSLSHLSMFRKERGRLLRSQRLQRSASHIPMPICMIVRLSV